MANTVLKDKFGPDWPLGLIQVPTPGTPVRLTVNVDPNNNNAPETPSSSSTLTNPQDEYSPGVQQLILQGFTAGAAPPALKPNTGNAYLIRFASGGAGSGHVGGGTPDFGVIVAVIPAGATLVFASPAVDNRFFSPYRYAVDVDTANDALQVTAIIG